MQPSTAESAADFVVEVVLPLSVPPEQPVRTATANTTAAAGLRSQVIDVDHPAHGR